jgi:hypothetical protein
VVSEHRNERSELGDERLREEQGAGGPVEISQDLDELLVRLAPDSVVAFSAIAN